MLRFGSQLFRCVPASEQSLLSPLHRKTLLATQGSMAKLGYTLKVGLKIPSLTSLAEIILTAGLCQLDI